MKVKFKLFITCIHEVFKNQSAVIHC
jgi:hypothetical protein